MNTFFFNRFIKRQNLDKHKVGRNEGRGFAFGGSFSSLNPLWILAESRWLIFPSLQAEVFLPVIVFISPKEQGPAGAGAPARARDKAHSRAPPGRGQGRGGAALRGPPAGRPQLPSSAAPPTPAARRPIRRVCCPGARAPETPVRARPHGWGLAPSAHPHRPSRPISGPGMRSPQARSLARGALTREAPPPPPPHAAPVRAPLPHAPRRARQLSSPATASAPAPPPTPAAWGCWGGAEWGPPPNTATDGPQTPQLSV